MISQSCTEEAYRHSVNRCQFQLLNQAEHRANFQRRHIMRHVSGKNYKGTTQQTHPQYRYNKNWKRLMHQKYLDNMSCLTTTTHISTLKRKRFAGSITDNVTTTLPPRKIVRVMSALPDRLVKHAPQSSPQAVLESILSARGVCTNVHSFDKIPSFFHSTKEEEIDAYDFDVLSAIRRSDLEELRKYHKSGRPMKCSNKFGESLLHLACRKSLVSVVDFLINEAGVPVQVADDMGRSPFHDAFWTPEPNTELVDLLLKKCPDLLFVKDKRGHTPLMYARRDHWGKWSEYLTSRTNILEPRHLNTTKQ